MTPQAIGAIRAVLPGDTRIAAVGGITPDNMSGYVDTGVNGFGLGSALFKPSYSMPELRKRAAAFVEAAAVVLPGEHSLVELLEPADETLFGPFPPYARPVPPDVTTPRCARAAEPKR